MSITEKLERLVRIIPGVAGYQDREKSRETDKAVRLRLFSGLEQIRLAMEKERDGSSKGITSLCSLPLIRYHPGSRK